MPSRLVVVQKDGKFKNLPVYMCAQEEDKCNLFLLDSDLANPMCRCGVVTRENEVKKETNNHGRKFVACGARKCGFFKWTS
jgi:hypothetical protein